MAKIVRSFYAAGPLRNVAREIANQSGLDGRLFAYEGLHTRKAAGRKRVRVTISIEPAPDPKPRKGSKPRRPAPVQLTLDVAPPVGSVVNVTGRASCEEQDMGGQQCPAGQCCREGSCRRVEAEMLEATQA